MSAWGPGASSTEDDDDEEEERTCSDGFEQFGGNAQPLATEGPSFSFSDLFSFLSLHPNFDELDVVS